MRPPGPLTPVQITEPHAVNAPPDRANPPAEAALIVRGLTKSFGSRRAVDGLDLSVAHGEAVGLLGPNGAGKSTSLSILSTLLRPDGGTARVLGLDPSVAGSELRRRIGVVPQEIALYGGLTAKENLELFAELYGVTGPTRRDRVAWALDAAGLEGRKDSRVGTFSGGMKRRLNLVCALLHGPELVFLDEPTAGVDPQSRNHVFEQVEALHAAGTTLIYTTHQMGEVERLCDRIVIMDRGRSIADGTLDELHRVSLASVASGGTRHARSLRLMDEADTEDAIRVLAAAGIRAEAQDAERDLESIFLSLTGRALRDGTDAVDLVQGEEEQA